MKKDLFMKEHDPFKERNLFPFPELRNWSLVLAKPPDPYTAPELIVSCLKGEVYGHPRFSLGHPVITSALYRAWKNKDGHFFAQTANTTYRLMKLDPNYAQWLEDHRKNIDALFAQEEKEKGSE